MSLYEFTETRFTSEKDLEEAENPIRDMTLNVEFNEVNDKHESGGFETFLIYNFYKLPNCFNLYCF